MKNGQGYASAILVVCLLAMVGVPSLAFLVWSTPDEVREIRIVARDMTFYVDGETAPNPTLHLKRGERVRIVLRNEDAGMAHDVSIREWDVTMKPLQGREGEHTVTFRAPTTAGVTPYSCTPHATMMRGSIVVE